MKFERVAALGAEVSGIDLSGTLSDAEIDEIEAGLLKHRVLFFRNQDLNGGKLVEFSRRFGESFIQPAAGAQIPGTPVPGERQQQTAHSEHVSSGHDRAAPTGRPCTCCTR